MDRARSLDWFGGLDLRPGNVMQDAARQLKLVDPYFVTGVRLIPAMLEDIDAVARPYSAAALRSFLEITIIEEEQDHPGSVLQQLRTRLEGLGTGG